MTNFDEFFISSEGEFASLYKGQQVATRPNLVAMANTAVGLAGLIPGVGSISSYASVALKFFDSRSEEQKAYSKYIELKNQTKSWLLQAPNWSNAELNQRAIEAMNAIEGCKAKYAARDSAGGRYMYHYISRLAYLQAIKESRKAVATSAASGGQKNQSFVLWLLNLLGL